MVSSYSVLVGISRVIFAALHRSPLPSAISFSDCTSVICLSSFQLSATLQAISCVSLSSQSVCLSRQPFVCQHIEDLVCVSSNKDSTYPLKNIATSALRMAPISAPRRLALAAARGNDSITEQIKAATTTPGSISGIRRTSHARRHKRSPAFDRMHFFFLQTADLQRFALGGPPHAISLCPRAVRSYCWRD